MPTAVRWLIAPLLGTAIAAGALRRKALSPSGAAGASVVGAAVFGAAGLRGSTLLLLFFGSSSALSKVSRGAKVKNGPRRTLTQVLANGAVPALLAVAGAVRPSQRLDGAYAGALAAANADTWATEIGALSGATPRMITTGEIAQPGVSGAITPLGTAASAAGAVLIGTAAAALYRRPAMAASSGTAGFAGAMADSLLGATLQAVYTCRRCAARTEDRMHAHDGETPQLTLVRGRPLMTNDAVNVCASLTGAMVGGLLAAPRRGA